MTIVRLFLSFLKIGVIGFGGGSALIPVIHSEVVKNSGAMSEEDYLKHTVVANITPGTLPVKLGATCGLQLTSPLGSVIAAYASAVPGVMGTVLIIAFFSMMGEAAIHYLNHASLGITIFIIFLLLHYVGKTVESGNFRVNAVTCLLAFLLTAGKEIREIVELAAGLPPHSLGVSVFNLSMINIMILAFYCIFYFQLAGRNAGRVALGVLLGLVFAFASGDMAKSWPHAGAVRLATAGLFFAAILILWFRRPRHGSQKTMPFQRATLWAIILFVVLPVLPFAYGLATGNPLGSGGVLAFLGDVVISTLTSFGGGEAYVAVADSIFVQTGYCDAEIYYGRIVPVANALPGPILVKIAAAIGFVWGQNTMGMNGGLALATLCTMASVGACNALALVVLNYYDALRHSVFVMSLKRYILPVICGTLISTSLAMLYESMKIAGQYDCVPLKTFVVMLACVALTFWINAKCKTNDLVLLIGWIVVSMAFMRIWV